MAERAHLSIVEVLSLLQDEFPDITISKIRFLESQGLLDPERTPSGYRKFYEPDIERLRWILHQQKENFLPLRVIKDRLAGESEHGGAGGEDPRLPPLVDTVVARSVPETPTARVTGIVTAPVQSPPRPSVAVPARRTPERVEPAEPAPSSARRPGTPPAPAPAPVAAAVPAPPAAAAVPAPAP